MRKLMVLAIIAMIVAGGYFGYGVLMGGPPQMPDFPTPVRAAKVTVKPLDITLEAVGSLVANESVVLRPEITGRITGIAFTEGQMVKKGAKLFQIDDRMAMAELKQAESNLRLARLNFERFRKLSSTGAATKQRYDEANAQLGVAQANVDLARARIDYASINAPFDGVVGLRHVSPGDYVNVGQELANFVSLNPMKVDFTIPETQAPKLAVGQTLDVEVEAMPGKQFAGQVYALDPQLDVRGRAVVLRARVNNDAGLLKPGYFARIAVLVERKEAAMLVPENAIVPQGDAKFVYIVTPEKTAKLVPVTLGVRQAGMVEILTGLEPEAQVVTSGQIKLRDGANVMTEQPGGKRPGKPS